MKKLLLLLLVIIVSCSSEDSIDQRNFDFLISDWEYIGGTFSGNNKTGIVDPFFNGTLLEFNISSKNFYRFISTYPNLSRGSISVLIEDNEFKAGQFIDEGIKRSNVFTAYYDGIENLIDSNSNEILLNKRGAEEYEVIYLNNTMSWTKELEEYTIIYNFVKQ
jgi:hypothetical protein